MKTDSIFYSLFQSFPSIFFELLNCPPSEANFYEFTSREVKQLAFRLDGLFLPNSNDSGKPFYVVEVQFQPDDNLYYRLFGELFLFLRQYQPPYPWQVVVIYPSRSVERQQTLQFRELLGRVTSIYLDELDSASESSLGVGVVKLVIESEKTAPQAARRLIEQAQVQLTDELTGRDLIDLIETIIIYKLPQKSRKEIEAMLGLAELKQTKVYQEAKEEGLVEGEQKGKEQGKQQSKLETIPRLLDLGLNNSEIAEALDLSLEIVAPAAELFHQQNLTAFVELLKHQRLLFSAEDLAELAGLIARLPERIEALSRAISLWCKHQDRSEQLKALKQLRQALSSGTVEEGLGTSAVMSTELTINRQILLEILTRK